MEKHLEWPHQAANLIFLLWDFLKYLQHLGVSGSWSGEEWQYYILLTEMSNEQKEMNEGDKKLLFVIRALGVLIPCWFFQVILLLGGSVYYSNIPRTTHCESSAPTCNRIFTWCVRNEVVRENKQWRYCDKMIFARILLSIFLALPTRTLPGWRFLFGFVHQIGFVSFTTFIQGFLV